MPYRSCQPPRHARRQKLMRTIYHVLPEAEPFSELRGGAISRWAGNALNDDGQTTIVCPSADGTWTFSSRSLLLLPALATYHRFRRRLTQISPLLHSLLLRRIFKPLLGRLRPGDVVWIHNRPDFALALAASIRRAGASLVLHMHNSHLVDWSTSLMRKVHVDRILFVSQFLLDQARAKFPRLSQSEVLYNGADEAIFYPANREEHAGRREPVVLFAGRLVQDKGVHILVDAMRLLDQERVPLSAWLVGGADFSGSQDSPYILQLKAAAPETVRFLPYQSGPMLGDLFRQADIFCSPSVWDEPFGMVNVEALACALPVVTTRVGGVPEVFAEGGGILVERGSARQLADALRELARNGPLRSHLAQQGYAAFQRRFTWAAARIRVQEVLGSLPA